MIKVYESMNKIFSDNRHRVREDFATFFAYIFKKWGDFSKIVASDESLDLRWCIPFSDVERLSDEKIRDCMERDKDEKDADAWNRSVYTHMSTQKSLRLLVGHDIVMAKGKAAPNSQRIHSAGGDGKFRYFRRLLSMLVPSALLLLAWAGIPPEMELHLGMRYHLKTMHVF